MRWLKWLKIVVGQGFIFHAIIPICYNVISKVNEPSYFSMLKSKISNPSDDKNLGGVFLGAMGNKIEIHFFHS